MALDLNDPELELSDLVTAYQSWVMAVINDDIVSVGDSLSGKAIVKAIGPGEVRLDVQGREIRLTL